MQHKKTKQVTLKSKMRLFTVQLLETEVDGLILALTEPESYIGKQYRQIFIEGLNKLKIIQEERKTNVSGS